MNISDQLRRPEVRDLIKHLAMVFAGIAAVFVVFKVIIPPLINRNTSIAFNNILPVIVLALVIVLGNKLQLMSSIEWLKRILMETGGSFKFILPIIGDMKLRDSFYRFQYELGSDFKASFIVGVSPVIASIISTIASINFIRVLIIEGYEYYTSELMFATLIMFVAYILLLNCRALALGAIVDSCKDRTYLGNTFMYTILPKVTTILWFLFFIVPMIIKPLARFTQIPIISLIAILFPILVLPIASRIGIKKTATDIISSYDMDGMLNKTKYMYSQGNFQGGGQQGYISPEYQSQMDQNYGNYNNQGGYDNYNNYNDYNRHQ